jgi:hypothetical protein
MVRHPCVVPDHAASAEEQSCSVQSMHTQVVITLLYMGLEESRMSAHYPVKWVHRVDNRLSLCRLGAYACLERLILDRDALVLL